jgi:cytochrome c-type biogenesis protein CcmH/NrfF
VVALLCHPPTGDQATALAVAGSVVGLLVLGAAVVFGNYRSKRRQRVKSEKRANAKKKIATLRERLGK